MATQMLIYETAVPLTHQRHGPWSLQAGGDFGFARQVNAVPLMAVEFAPASDDYAIVFAGKGGEVMPAAILGLRAKQNLYLDAALKWNAKYVPAFVRRYPFVFSGAADGKTFTVCIDEAYSGFNQAGHGQRLFGDDAKPTPYTQGVLKFLQEYQAQFMRTQAFGRKLAELKLLAPMQADLAQPGGPKTSLSGFLAVDRKKLRELPGAALEELARNDGLELLYLHLHSLRNFNGLKDRFVAAQPLAAPSAAASPAA